MKLESQDATQQVPRRVPSQSIQPGSGRQRRLNAKSIPCTGHRQATLLSQPIQPVTDVPVSRRRGKEDSPANVQGSDECHQQARKGRLGPPSPAAGAGAAARAWLT